MYRVDRLHLLRIGSPEWVEYPMAAKLTREYTAYHRYEKKICSAFCSGRCGFGRTSCQFAMGIGRPAGMAPNRIQYRRWHHLLSRDFHHERLV